MTRVARDTGLSGKTFSEARAKRAIRCSRSSMLFKHTVTGNGCVRLHISRLGSMLGYRLLTVDVINVMR